MKAKKFIAGTTSAALKLAKTELGEDAIILSHKIVEGRAQVMAVSHLTVVEEEKKESHFLENQEDLLKKNVLFASSNKENFQKEEESKTEKFIVEQIKEEFDVLRNKIESSLSCLNWGREVFYTDDQIAIFKKLGNMGFSNEFLKQLLVKLPGEFNCEEAKNFFVDAILEKLLFSPLTFSFPKRVKAFLGPSGVGKTHLIAKIILSFIKKELNPEKIAFIFVNRASLKVLEESKLYGRIFNIDSYYAETYEELEKFYRKSLDKDFIFMDFPSYDFNVESNNFYIDFLKKYTECADTTLVLSSGFKELKKYFNVHKEISIDNVSVTKLDESLCCGEIIDYAVLKKVPFRFLTKAQDFHSPLLMANKEYLKNILIQNLHEIGANENEDKNNRKRLTENENG